MNRVQIGDGLADDGVLLGPDMDRRGTVLTGTAVPYEFAPVQRAEDLFALEIVSLPAVSHSTAMSLFQ
jgi:hypothetical protein